MPLLRPLSSSAWADAGALIRLAASNTATDSIAHLLLLFMAWFPTKVFDRSSLVGVGDGRVQDGQQRRR